jgi:hypothetical protein
MQATAPPIPVRGSRNGNRIKAGCAIPARQALEQRRRADGVAVQEPLPARGLRPETWAALGLRPEMQPPGPQRVPDLRLEMRVRDLPPAPSKPTGLLPLGPKIVLLPGGRDQALPPSVRVVLEGARLAVAPAREATVTAGPPAAVAVLEAHVVVAAEAAGGVELAL